MVWLEDRAPRMARVLCGLMTAPLLLLGCGDEVETATGSGTAAGPSGSGSSGSGAAGSGASGSGGSGTGGAGASMGAGAGPIIEVGQEVPDFSLVDQNATSTSFGQAVSPRDFLEQVSGWYFGHAT